MKKIALSICFSLAFLLTEAQQPTVATPTIIPQNPTAASIIKVVVKVSTPNSLVVVDPNSNLVNGQQIKIKGCYSPGMLPFAQSYIDTLIIGQLPLGSYQITQKAYLSSTQQHCTPIDSNQVTLSLTVSSGTVSTGISQTEAPLDGTFYVYPNPSISSLFISGTSSEAEASIFSTTGALINKEILNKNSIDIQNLTAGLYFITITDKGKSHTQKFIKSETGQ